MSLPPYFTGERSTLEAFSRQQCQAVPLTDRAILCRVLGRYLMFADADDFTVTPHMSLNGFWESWTTLAMARQLQRGAYCVDVGANHGYFTLIMADAAGPDGHVLAIEPNPRLAQLLVHTLEVNGFEGHTAVLQKGASDAAGRPSQLVIPRHRYALGTLRRLPTGDDDSVEVETATLDEVTDTWPRVDFVKIDAEGSEEAIWRGMECLLARNADVTVVMELKPSGCADPAGFLGSIQAAGFRLRHIQYDSTVSEVTREEILTDRSGGDWMLCLQRQ